MARNLTFSLPGRGLLEWESGNLSFSHLCAKGRRVLRRQLRLYPIFVTLKSQKKELLGMRTEVCRSMFVSERIVCHFSLNKLNWQDLNKNKLVFTGLFIPLVEWQWTITNGIQKYGICTGNGIWIYRFTLGNGNAASSNQCWTEWERVQTPCLICGITLPIQDDLFKWTGYNCENGQPHRHSSRPLQFSTNCFPFSKRSTGLSLNSHLSSFVKPRTHQS